MTEKKTKDKKETSSINSQINKKENIKEVQERPKFYKKKRDNLKSSNKSMLKNFLERTPSTMKNLYTELPKKVNTF